MNTILGRVANAQLLARVDEAVAETDTPDTHDTFARNRRLQIKIPTRQKPQCSRNLCMRFRNGHECHNIQLGNGTRNGRPRLAGRREQRKNTNPPLIKLLSFIGAFSDSVFHALALCWPRAPMRILRDVAI